MDERIYVHFGDNKFRPELVVPATGRKDKPSGLWASPEESDWRWDHWCRSEGFWPEKRLKRKFRFVLKAGTRVLHVYALADVLPYTDMTGGAHLAFERLYADFDAMELHYQENRFNLFGTWDMDSIVIWHPDVVRVL